MLAVTADSRDPLDDDRAWAALAAEANPALHHHTTLPCGLHLLALTPA